MHRSIRGVMIALAVLACLLVAWGVWARLAPSRAYSGLPAAPTVSYAPAGGQPVNLAAALRAVGPNIADSNAQWRLLTARFAGQIAAVDADRQWRSMQSDVRVDARHARYLLLSDSSPVLPIGPVTALPPLQRRPVWLVPTSLAHETVVPGMHSYLVLDARSGRLLEHLQIVPVDPFAACASGDTSFLGLGRVACMLQHLGDARTAAYRSVA